MDMVTQIFELCIFPLLAILTSYIVQFIRVKTSELNIKQDNELAKKYSVMISQTITDCVIATNQTYVESLKAQNKFDEEAQKEAFKKTYDAVVAILAEDAIIYIQETAGDVATYLTQQIEAQVNKNKSL